MRISRFWITFCFVVGLALPLLASLTLAQNSTIIVTVTAQEWMQDTFNDELFSEFEAQNPGVDAVFVIADNMSYVGSAAYGTEGFFDRAAEYAQSADVLYVDNYSLSPEATRAGILLDLSPLTSSDSSLNQADFFPAAWESFQWDGGVWALPASMSLNVLIYNKTRFDELGLGYPNEAWTIDDFASAVRALSETDSEGEVTSPGFVDWGSSGLLFRALLGHGIYDDSVIPNAIDLQDPQLEQLLTTWSELVQEGHTGWNFSGSSQEIPLRIEGLYALSGGFRGAGSDDEWAASLLPGGVAGVRTQGFAVSAGTQYPEQAYALAKFLTSSVEVTTRFFGDSPARQSLVGLEPEDGSGFRIDLPAEAEAIRDEALAAALPASELRFMDYVNAALGSMNPEMNPEGDSLDVTTALQEAEDSANAALQAADEWRSSASVVVVQPTPTPVLSADEISLRFQNRAFISPIPNRDKWEQTIQEFAASDPQVGQIEFLTGFGPSEEDIDCYIQPYNAVPSLDLTTVLNLDPYFDADPSFDRSDFLTGVLDKVSRENMTWALPMYVQPEVLWYDSEMFNEAGAQLPENGWTIDQFIDALHVLRVDPEDPAPFVPSGGGSYMLLLTAAFGGLPLDYRTDPPTVSFNEPATVDAIRQVLDLAKEGYIKYSELGNMMSSGSFGGSGDQAIYNEVLSAFSWRLTASSDAFPSDYSDPYRLTTFPRGTQYSGIAYDIGAGYINAEAQNPDACYRWLSYLSSRADLFSAMPARRSGLSALESGLVTDADLSAAFNEIDALLQDPATITLPTQFGGGGSIAGFLLPIWLNQAFDAYVLEDADLEAELDEAQMTATTYLECVSGIEELPMGQLMEMSQDEQIAYSRQFTDCAVSVDPSLASVFSFPEDE
jgi:ABC-type glycerol-3-phosphate transport system substrate-binding protein